jgi:hypothetical protein
MKIDDKVLEAVKNSIRDEMCFINYTGEVKLPPQDLEKIAQATITAYLKETQPTAETNYTIKSNSSNGESK